VLDAHSVGSIGNNDLGVFTVTKIAMEDTSAVASLNAITRTPNAAYLGPQRFRPPIASLTCFAWLAAWQSLHTGHKLPQQNR
jgi:hypothetical protein